MLAEVDYFVAAGEMAAMRTSDHIPGEGRVSRRGLSA
jgi:hypothetical protein